MVLKKIFILLIIFCLSSQFVYAADKEGLAKKKIGQPLLQSPIVEDDWKFHKIGTLWTRVTNFGKTGDDAYEGRTPSCDWPGGSGNSYLYRGSIWLTAKVDGVVHSSTPEDTEFAPIDSVHLLTGNSATRGNQETYTRYYDVNAPLAEDHIPLGLEVTERTFAWSASYSDDFIIYEFTIKNVGIDTDEDGYPDTPRDLQEFYFTYRLDGDVSKLSNWETEMPYSNQDDLVGINASWDFLELFPEWQTVDHGLTPETADTTLMFMFDADNPYYPSELEGEDNDLGNPGPDGTLQSPGFLGIKICKIKPAGFKISKFRTGHIYNDPGTDKIAYDKFMAHTPGENPFEHEGPSGIVVDNGLPFPYDYRGFLTIGPLEILAAGDSVVITMALGVGADPERGGIYSLMELVKNMTIAQLIVDNDYELELQAPPTPTVEVTEHLIAGKVQGVKIMWDNIAETDAGFQGYRVWKSSGKTAAGAYKWSVLAEFDIDSSASWPPPVSSENMNIYEIIDPDVINGFDYNYSVQTYSIEYPEPFGVLESNILGNLKIITPANPVATDLSRVKVVPNPYVGSANWNNPIPSDVDAWEHRLQFINLPADATIKIFTLDGDFVDEIRAGESVRKSESFTGSSGASVAEWDLITRNNQEAAPGIYLYVVKSPSAGETVGKFVIVR